MPDTKIDQLKEIIAHGSGIDSDWDIELKEITWVGKGEINILNCSNSYHAMNENGMYVGWVDFIAYYTLDFELFHVSANKKDIIEIQNQFTNIYLDDLEDYLWQALEIIEE